MRTNSLLVLIVAIALGGLAAYLARGVLVSRSAATSEHLGTIVAAATALPFGTPLTNDNTKEIPWAAKALPTGAFASKHDLFAGGKRISLAVIQSDEPILSSKVTGPGERASLSTLLDPDKRAITVRVDDVRGVAGFILPNDRVDVVLIRSESGSAGRRDFSDLLLQDVKVIAVDQIFSGQKDKPVVAKAVTLEVTPRQAQRISLATSVGHLSLILRKAGDSQVVENERITQSDLIEGEAPRVEASAAPAPVKMEVAIPAPSRDTTVTIMRDLRSQDYKVPRQAQ
jgi:pilus assembly protein CpaB